MKYIEINGKKIKVFTPKDLSELISYSEGWVRERIKRGELRCSISNVPPYLFTIMDINNFINEYPQYFNKIKINENIFIPSFSY